MTPSAAVTETTRSLSPVCNPVSPVISNEASGSVVSTTTSTSVVPGSTSTEPPFSASIPFTVKVDSEVSVFGSTMSVISVVEVVSPSAAVTTTASWFSPTTRPLSPMIATVASGSLVFTSTSTSVLPHSRVSSAPSATSSPLTKISAEASTFGRTFRTTV